MRTDESKGGVNISETRISPRRIPIGDICRGYRNVFFTPLNVTASVTEDKNSADDDRIQEERQVAVGKVQCQKKLESSTKSLILMYSFFRYTV